MHYFVDNYEGWMFFDDEEGGYFVSPSGRLAEFPGGTFFGTLTSDEFDEGLDQAGTNPSSAQYDRSTDSITYNTEDNQDMNVDEIEAELENAEPVDVQTYQDGDTTVIAKTYKIGDDITVNIVEVS